MYAPRTQQSCLRSAKYIWTEGRISRLGNAKLLSQTRGQGLQGAGHFVTGSIFLSANLGTHMQERLAAWCITCVGIDLVGQFVLNKYNQILFYFF